MKKLFIAILSILTVLSFSSAAVCYAENVETDIVLPESYLEYFDLSAPVDVWTDGTFYAIAERERIIIFDGTLYKTKALSGYSISKIDKKGNYVLFLSGSKVYTLDLNNDLQLDTNTGIIAATSFCIYGNTLATNASNSVNFYNITNCETAFTVTANLSKTFTYDITAMSLANENTLYYALEGKIMRFSQNVTEEVSIGNLFDSVRYTSYTNGYVYISAAKGIYKLNLASGNVEALKAVGTDTALKNLVEPQGIFYTEKGLLVCDSEVNAIMLYDVAASSFTDFYITSEATAENRITKTAKQIFGGLDNLYTLDEYSIKITDYKSEKSVKASVSLAGFYGAKLIAAANNLFLLSNSTNLQLAKISANALEGVQVLSDTSAFTSVASLCAYENDFYFINNETVEGITYAGVYKLSSTTCIIEKIGALRGRGEVIAADLFGDLYIEVFDMSEYRVYACDTTFSKQDFLFSNQTKLLSLVADYEGSVYALASGNKIIKSNGESVTVFDAVLSQNLPLSSEAVSLALIPATDNAYLLFGGFILKLSSAPLEISTPSKITVPSGFAVTLNNAPTVVTVKSGSKLFTVSLEDTKADDKYFAYTGYVQAANSSHEYLLLNENGRYALIADKERAAIVRVVDTVKLEKTVATENTAKYAVNPSGIYSLPILSEYYKLNQIDGNASVRVIGSISFNGVEYYLTETSNGVGYLARTMLKNQIVLEATPMEFTTKTVSRDGAKYFGDETLQNELGSLSGYQEIHVLSENNGVVKIMLEDGSFAYLFAAEVVSAGSYVIRNVLLIGLLALAVLISSVYLIRRLIYSKKML